MTTTLKTRPQIPLEIAVEPAALNAELSFPKGIYNSEQQALALGSKIGVGGEGTVYNIQGQADLVAKIYHEPPSAEKAEKLIALARLGTERLFKMSAWPVDVLRDRPDGNVIGFVMKKIGQAEEVHTLHSPKSRLKKFPDASWAFLLHVATNIARAVATMHEHGFIVGDVNPKNILVTRQATVYLLDCDSLQFSAEGKTYRCEGGFPEYTPPELQGIPFSEVDRNQEHDCFGLAVVIFQLLFLGRHPYSGRFLGAGEMPLEKAIREFRFAYGSDAAERQIQPPPGTLSLNAIPANIVALFRRAFLEMDRPSPQEWIEPLNQFAAALKSCESHSGHYFYRELAKCPWCDLETRARLRLFNFQLAGGQSHKKHFRLDEIWQEIEGLKLTKLSAQEVKPQYKISSEAEQYTRWRRNKFRFGMAFAALAGFLIGYLFNFPLFGILVWFVILVAKEIADAEVQSLGKMQTIFSSQPTVSDHPFARRLNDIQMQAKARIYEIERELNDQKNGEPSFARKVNDLKSKLHDYEIFTKRNQRKLKKQAARHSTKAKTKIVEELDRKRQHLEYEITSNAYYLRHLKQQLNAKRAQLLPELAKQEQRLAQVEKDLEVVSWKNPMMPIIVIVVASFFFGAAVSSSGSFLANLRGVFSNISPSLYSDVSPKFNAYFNEGLLWIQKKDYQRAKDFLLLAEPYISIDNWNHRYASYYHNLCYTRVVLKEENQFIGYLVKELTANPTREDYRIQLVMLYSMKKYYSYAGVVYQQLKSSRPQIAASLQTEMKSHGVDLEALPKQ